MFGPAANVDAARLQALGSLVLAGAVAVAFADSSIVVLALPQLLAELDTSIVGVSWVITAYNAVVAAATLGLGRRLARASPRVLSVAGLLVFLAASVGCALCTSLGALVAVRCLQGAGAALLLTGTLPLLAATAGSQQRGTAVWVAAGVVGAAIGPALGGALTEAFDWRAIFLVQAPVAALALPVALTARARAAPRRGTSSPTRIALSANVALALVFAALAGALFLVVVLLVDVWGMSPLGAATAVSALPIATLVGGRLEGRPTGAATATGGVVALAAGLAGLALLPATSVPLVVWALALCGVGLGLALPFLTLRSLEGRSLTTAGAYSIGARHAGLVLALVLVAPLLARGVDSGAERAALGATAAVLDAPVGVRDKIGLALALDATIDDTPRGSMPDVEAAFVGREREGVGELQTTIVDTLESTLTRSFRPSFVLAALFAALAAVPLLLLRRPG